MQTWKKLGLICGEEVFNKFSFQYAAVPVAEHVSENTFRIFFSYRNDQNKSLPGCLLFDLKKLKIQEVELNPVIEPGQPGFFDEDGIMPCDLIKIGDRKFLYYIGWNKAITVPFRNALGLAISTNDSEYKKYTAGPVLDRSIYDPCFVASACILQEKEVFRMWYLSCIEWTQINNSLVHTYHIKYAESADGIHWKRNGQVAIDFKYENEYAISVPRVIKDADVYKMWYSFRGGPRGKNYQIGYAESSDGLNWLRKDELVNLDVSSSGWDNEMICYPFIFDHEGERYMLYNGNGFGKTGFGIARLDKK